MLVFPYREDPFWSMMLASGLAPKALSCFGSSDRLIYSTSLRWALHSLFSLQCSFSSAFEDECSEECCIQSKRETDSPPRNKAPSELLSSLYSSVNFLDYKTRPHLFTGAVFSTVRKREMMTKQDCRMTQCVLAVGCHPDLKNIKSSAVVI